MSTVVARRPSSTVRSMDRKSAAVPHRASGRATQLGNPAGLPWLVLALSLAAFGFGVHSIAPSKASQFGLLAGASPLYGLSLLLAAVGFGVAMRMRNRNAAIAAIIVMVACARLPRAISTEAPMYSWTYKHLGVVDYIQTHGELARGTDIYNGWPGLFAATAWFSDLTGVPPIDIAHWFTPMFHLGFAGLMYAAARAWQLTPDQALTAAFLVVTLNWVEQDYFAPQAMAMILTAAIVMLIGLSRERRTGMVLLLIAFTAVTITHQLTPYWIFLAAGLLVVGRRLMPWWILIPMAVILIGFFFCNFDITHNYRLFSADVVDNATTNNHRVGVLGQIFTSTSMRILSVGTWFATAVILLRRAVTRRPVWALGVLALSPILILGGQSYGGEAVFRVFLYSLPGCAIVIAPYLLAGLRSRGIRLVAAAGALVIATGLSAQANLGNWYTNLITKTQVDSANALLAGADYPAYITPLVPVWPERSTGNYVKYANYTDKFDHSLMFQEPLLGLDFKSQADYEKLMILVQSRTDASTYVVLSNTMTMYGPFFGLFPYDAVANLREHMNNDPRWHIIENGPDVGIYLYRVPAS